MDRRCQPRNRSAIDANPTAGAGLPVGGDRQHGHIAGCPLVDKSAQAIGRDDDAIAACARQRPHQIQLDRAGSASTRSTSSLAMVDDQRQAAVGGKGQGVRTRDDIGQRPVDPRHPRVDGKNRHGPPSGHAPTTPETPSSEIEVGLRGIGGEQQVRQPHLGASPGPHHRTIDAAGTPWARSRSPRAVHRPASRWSGVARSSRPEHPAPGERGTA